MQKKLLLILAFSLIIVRGRGGAQNICIKNFSGNCAKKFSSIKEMQDFLDESVNLAQSEIQDPIPFSFLNEQLAEVCSESSIKKAQSAAEGFKGIWLQGILDTQINKEMIKRFQFLQYAIGGLKVKDDESYCHQRGLLLSLMEITQKTYFQVNNIVEKKSILDSNNEKKSASDLSPSSEGDQGTIAEHSSPNLADTSSQRTFMLESLLLKNQVNWITPKHYLVNLLVDDSPLSPGEEAFALSASSLIQTEIMRMYTKGLLNQEDIARVKDNIKLNFVERCGNLKGTFHLLRKKDGSDIRVKEIDLKVNICYDSHYLSNFSTYIRQLLAHELGHYFYFFKDQKSQIFDAFCWDNADNNSCKSEDFVSAYAQEKKEEDYAESFSYRYMDYEKQLEHGAAPSQMRTIKYRYFDQVFGN